jgi:hypothetical protein
VNLAVALLLVLATVSGCAPRPTATVAPKRASPEVVAPADRLVTLPSGATLKVAADWRVTAVNDGLTLEDPERQLKVELVEVAASVEMKDVLSAAWRRRRPGFDRQELASSDSPGREGWDLFHWSRYRTSPAEARRVSAFVARKGALAVVVLIDGPLAAVQRRSSQIALIHDSLRPAGYVRESYRGRTPRPLDATRVAYLKEFIDQMRGKAEAEEDLLSAVREARAYPPEASEVKRLAGSYRNAALGDIVVRAGQAEVVFQFGGWRSRMATKVNPDGTTSFVSVDPGVRGFEFHAPAASGPYTRLTLRDPQHTYEYESGR